MRSTSRRDAIKQIGSAGAGFVLAGGVIRGHLADIVIAGQPVEIAVSSVSPDTVRITVRQIQSEGLAPIATTGALVQDEFGKPLAQSRTEESFPRVRAGNLVVRYTRQSGSPPTIHVETPGGAAGAALHARRRGAGTVVSDGQRPAARIGRGRRAIRPPRIHRSDAQRTGRRPSPTVIASPSTARGRRSSGSSAPIPAGACSSTSRTAPSTSPARTARSPRRPPTRSRSICSSSARAIRRRSCASTRASPGCPKCRRGGRSAICSRAARSTGEAEILGDRQDLPREEAAVRRLDLSRHGVRAVGVEHAQRRVHLASDELSRSQEDDRRAARRSLQGHRPRRRSKGAGCSAVSAIRARPRRSRAAGRPTIAWPPERQVACYWPIHKTALDVGVDGWWPDQGDGFDGPSRFNRHRMYWEGSQMYRPDERPFALHRNASAGVQRFGGFIWSGDVQNRWETLKVHVGIGINTGTVGIALLGHRHRRVQSDARVHGRTPRPLVSVRGLQSAVSRRMGATGISNCRGAGTAAKAAPSRPVRGGLRPRSCATRTSSRSARSIWSCGRV